LIIPLVVRGVMHINIPNKEADTWGIQYLPTLYSDLR
jgi:hypothetical protein